MPTNLLGVPNSNVFVPYSSATKRTKWITLTTQVSATDWTTESAQILFYADSTDKWHARFNLVGTLSSATTGIEITIDGVVFKTISSYNMQALSALLTAGGINRTPEHVRANGGASTISIYNASLDFDKIAISGDVELNAEPTWASLGTTAAAALEGALPVDVYIPSASAGIAGLVDNTAGNTGGTPIKGSINGSAPAISDIGYEIVEHCTVATVTTVADTEIDVTGCYIIVPEGVWDLSYYAVAGAYRASGNAPVWMRCRITDDSYNLETSTESLLGFENATSGLFGNYGIMTMSKRIYLTEEKTFKLRVTCNQSTANGAGYVYSTGSSIGGISGNDSTTYLRAVRAL